MTGNDLGIFDNIICGGEEVYLQSQGSQILLRGWTSAKHQGLFVVLQTKAIRRFVIMEKAPTRAFSWLKAATTAFT